MSDLDREIETTKVLVREALKEDERCRNEDLYLIWKVFNKITKVYIPFQSFRDLPSAETITRIRRSFNERGLFLPTDPKVLERRQRREREFREHYATEKVSSNSG